MFRHWPLTLALLAAATGAPVLAHAQDQPPPPPAQQSASPPPPSDKPAAKGDDAGLERARAAARAADVDNDDLEKARAAARAGDPRLQGIEKAREASRSADPTGGADCLSGSEARKAVKARKAVPLADAIRAAQDAMKGEVIDYRLCTYDGRLAYQLTLLNGDGKVIRARVEAVDGKLVNVK